MTAVPQHGFMTRRCVARDEHANAQPRFARLLGGASLLLAGACAPAAPQYAHLEPAPYTLAWFEAKHGVCTRDDSWPDAGRVHSFVASMDGAHQSEITGCLANEPDRAVAVRLGPGRAQLAAEWAPANAASADTSRCVISGFQRLDLQSAPEITFLVEATGIRRYFGPQGRVEQEATERAVSALSHGMMECLTDARRVQPLLPSHILMMLRIESDGAVSSARVLSNPTGAPFVGCCLGHLMRTWKLPPVDGGPADYLAPIPVGQPSAFDILSPDTSESPITTPKRGISHQL